MQMSGRAYTLIDVKSFDEEQRVVEGIASTPKVDRTGDIVEPLGAKFALPMPLLLDHDSRQQVGHVEFAKPTAKGIPFKASITKVSEPGEVRDLVDKAWQLVKYKLRAAVSIGFRAMDDGYEVMKNGGIRFTSWEWLELSLVTIPAQDEAVITGAKGFDDNCFLRIKSIDTALRAASGQKQDGDTPPGASGKSTKPVSSRPKEATTMSKKTIAEQISAFDATRLAKATEMDKIMDDAADRGETLNAEEKEQYDTLTAEVKEVDEHLGRLREREKTALATAKAVGGGTSDEGSRSRQVGVIQVRSPVPKGVGFVRLLGAKFMAREYNMSAADIAMSKGWGDDLVAVLRTPPDILVKAAVSAGTTTDQSWAGALVTYQNLQNEFIELLRPKTIIGRIPGIRMVPFNIKVPRETGETTAYWVSQGTPKPVSKGALDTVTLDFNKVAGLTFLTKELLRFSAPSAEQMMVNSLTKAIIKLTDNDFLDPSKAAVAGTSPASMTNGVTPITASGNTADAFRADFADLLAAYTAVNYTLDDLVLVMSQSQALRLGLLRNDFGGKEFPDINKDGGFIEGVPVITSENVAANGGSPADGRIIVALAANSVLMADDGGVEVNISTEASIQVDDSPDSPATASTVLVSMFQTNQVAILCERFITWVKARSGAAQYITGANYGN